SALTAIEVISEQGEGAGDSIWDSDDRFFGEERQLAHYFRFNEIRTGRSYGRHDTPRTPPSGPLLDVTWEDAYKIHAGWLPARSQGRGGAGPAGARRPHQHDHAGGADRRRPLPGHPAPAAPGSAGRHPAEHVGDAWQP